MDSPWRLKSGDKPSRDGNVTRLQRLCYLLHPTLHTGFCRIEPKPLPTICVNNVLLFVGVLGLYTRHLASPSPHRVGRIAEYGYLAFVQPLQFSSLCGSSPQIGSAITPRCINASARSLACCTVQVNAAVLSPFADFSHASTMRALRSLVLTAVDKESAWKSPQQI